MSGTESAGYDYEFVVWDQKKTGNISEAEFERVLELNNAAVPAVNHLDLPGIMGIIVQADPFILVRGTATQNNDESSKGTPRSSEESNGGEATKGSGASEVAGFIITLPPGCDYSSPNYVFFTKYFFEERKESFLYVDRIVIAPSFHRRGIGKRLYGAVAAEARARRAAQKTEAGAYNWVCAEVNVRPRNEQSLAFHEAAGFKSVGEQDVEGGTKTVTMLAMPI